MRLALLGLILSLITGVAVAQTTTGTIQVEATDQDGGALPGVTVVIRSPNLQGERIVVTDTQGFGRVTKLPSGQYTATFSLDGFQNVEQQNVQVGILGTARILAEMTSVFTEELIVTSETPAIDQGSAGLGFTADRDIIEKLPLGRGYAGVAAIAPGAQADDSGQTFFGSSGAENAYYIDGVNTTGIELGQQGKFLNSEFIQEVQVKTGSYSAEFGHSTGGIINVVTKSGGNEFHGDVFAYDESADDPKGEASRGAVTGDAVRQDLSRSDYGADLGGFLVKDHLWFFGAYNKTEDDSTFASSKDFASIIPGAPSTGQQIDNKLERDLWAFKLTANVATSHSFVVSLFGDPTTQEGPGLSAFNLWEPQASLAAPPTHYQQSLASGGSDASAYYDGIFGTSWVTTLRYAQHREKGRVEGPGTELVGYIDNTDPLGDSTVTWGWEGVAPSGIGFYQQQDFGRDQIYGDLSYYLDAAGHHQFKVGYETEDISVVNANRNSGTQRIYRFNCGSRCISMPDAQYYYRHRYFVSSKIDPGNATTADIVDPLVVDTKAEQEGFFLQDTWQATNNLSLMLGVRSDVQRLFNADGGVSADIDDQISPRLGFTWDPSRRGESKVFGHFGRFYETIPMDIVIRSFGKEITVFAYNYSTDPNDVAGLPTTELARGSTTLGGGISRVDPATKGQYIEEIVLGYQHNLSRNTTGSISYVSRDLNDVIEDALSVDGDYFIGNPGQGLMEGTYDLGYAFGYNNTLHQLEEPRREFEGVELSVRRRLSNNWGYLASLVWGDMTGTYDGLFQASTGQLDPNLNSAFDYYDFSVNNEGQLSNDREYQAKLDGFYNWDMGLVIGASAWYSTGTPITAMGYSGAYQNWEYYYSTRGSFGRTDDSYELSLHFGYPVRLGDRVELGLSLDVFNVLDGQNQTRRDIKYTGPDDLGSPLDWNTAEVTTITPQNNQGFEQTGAGFNTSDRWTLPRSYRIGVSFRF